MNALRRTCCVLMTTIFFVAGCATPKRGPNPLESGGWKLLPNQDPKKLDKAIRDDYQDYIEKLAVEEKSRGADILLFEDGTGRHAVRIEIPLDGKYREHVLFYDQNNRRVKANKRISGHYGDRWW